MVPITSVWCIAIRSLSCSRAAGAGWVLTSALASIPRYSPGCIPVACKRRAKDAVADDRSDGLSRQGLGRWLRVVRAVFVSSIRNGRQKSHSRPISRATLSPTPPCTRSCSRALAMSAFATKGLPSASRTNSSRSKLQSATRGAPSVRVCEDANSTTSSPCSIVRSQSQYPGVPSFSWACCHDSPIASKAKTRPPQTSNRNRCS